ncbi:MAG TPA: hemerythrin domain-containing protein [Stellaceae bacterium]|nr:hemerythrin domain-containing protein [Stellaceae bacterium]
MSRACEELNEEHRRIVQVLDCLERQVNRFAANERPDFDVIAATVEYFQGFPDLCHHPKEDRIFDLLMARDAISAWIVGDLEQAHRQLAEKLRSFAVLVHDVALDAELRRDEFAAAARRFIESQRQHLAMEEASFFPAAERALTPEDWVAVAAAARQLEALDRGSTESKFEALARDIRAWDLEDRATGRSAATPRPV